MMLQEFNSGFDCTYSRPFWGCTAAAANSCSFFALSASTYGLHGSGVASGTGGFNTLFCDGHVKYINQPQVTPALLGLGGNGTQAATAGNLTEGSSGYQLDPNLITQ